MWHVAGDRELARFAHDEDVLGVAFSPDGTRIATASADKTARVWDTASSRECARLPHGAWVWSVAFSPDGMRIATACCSSDKKRDDVRLELFDLWFDLHYHASPHGYYGCATVWEAE